MPPNPSNLPTEAQRPRRQWRRAFRALHELIQEPEHTEKAFEVLHALDGPAEVKSFREFTQHPDGRRLLEARPSLLAALSDRAALERLPDGSFGRAVLDHYDRNGLEPAKLAQLDRETDESAVPLDPLRAWFRERQMLMHDLWHVLTGYDADALGEASLLPFSLAQTGGFGTALLAVGANAHVTWNLGPAWLVYAARAWCRGRRAALLSTLPYEELLPRPLESVRQLAGIEPPNVAHRRGIWHDDPPPALAL